MVPAFRTAFASGAMFFFVGIPASYAAQTDAPELDATKIKVEEVIEGLENPWGLAFLPDGRLLITERYGRMQVVGKDGQNPIEIYGMPEVYTNNQGGIFDVLLAPDFESSGIIYFSFSEPRDGGKAGTSVMRARLSFSDKEGNLSDGTVIFRQAQSISGGRHFGGRLLFDKTGALFITTGDRGSEMESAQDLSTEIGKVIRITTEGKPAPDNPFLEQENHSPNVWSYGHRNMQGAVLHPETGELWVTEHGARGGDELNVAQKGKNYGWPVITYGIDYDGTPIGEGISAKEGMEQPVYYWKPSIATSGLEIYTGDLFPDWQGDLLAGGLVGAVLERLKLDDGKVVGVEKLLTDRGDRVRTVKMGPEGAVWVLTDAPDGYLLKLTPAE